MHDTEHEDRPSKTRRKRDMEALQELGSELLNFSDEVLLQMDLPENLRDAVQQARKIRSRGAHKRQLQYIGRLMRDIDLSGFAVADATVDVSGSSTVTVKPRGRLDVDASGASEVFYLGEPTLGKIDTSGSSSVEQK